MAETKVWLGGTSKDPFVDANWDTANELADDDVLIYNDQANQGCNGADLAAAGGAAAQIDVDVYVEPGFEYEIGSSGTPLEVSSYKYLSFKAGGLSKCYFGLSATGTGAYENVIVDTPNQSDPSLTLGGGGAAGTLALLSVLAGKVTFDTITTGASSILSVFGGGSPKAVLTIPSATTFNALTTLNVNGGTCNLGVDGKTVNVSGGTLILSDAAGAATLLNQTGGEVILDSTGATIAIAEIHGGKFMTRQHRKTNTISVMRMYNNAVVDLSQGGINMTLTDGIIKLGQNDPIAPIGAKIVWTTT